MLADDEVEVGVIGHAVALVRRTLDLDDAAVRVPAPPHVARHVGEQQEMIDRMPHRPLGEHAVRRHLDGRRVELDQFLEIRTRREIWLMASCFLPMATAHPRPVEARGPDTRTARVRHSLRRVPRMPAC